MNINNFQKKEKNNHLLDQAYFQMAWTRSFEAPAELQEESLDQFLWKENGLI